MKKRLRLKNFSVLFFVLLAMAGCQSDKLGDEPPLGLVEVVENQYKISEEDMLVNATTFLREASGKTTLRSLADEEITSEVKRIEVPVTLSIISSSKMRSVIQQVPLYTVNYSDLKGEPLGCVVMAGDERIENNILVFSEESAHIDIEARDDKDFLMDLFTGYIHRAINQNPENATLKKESSVELRTTSYPRTYYTLNMLHDWNQLGDPFSRYTPYRDGSRTLAGCVAVAMGHIMEYHGWPRVGAFEKYIDQNTKRPVSVTYNAADWNTLKNTLAFSTIKNRNPEVMDLVGNLLAEIGYKLNMDYRTSAANGGIRGSYAFDRDVSAVFREMGYKFDLFAGFNYSKVRNDIINGKIPVYMSGKRDLLGKYGHSYVVMGICVFTTLTDHEFIGIHSGSGGDIHADGYYSTYYYNKNCFTTTQNMEQPYPYRYFCQTMTGIRPTSKTGSTNAYFRVSDQYPY